MAKNDELMKKPRVKLTKAEVAFALRRGDYWDTHSLADVWAQTKPVQMDVDLRTSTILVHLKPELAAKVEGAARRKRLSVDRWLARLMERELVGSEH